MSTPYLPDGDLLSHDSNYISKSNMGCTIKYLVIDRIYFGIEN